MKIKQKQFKSLLKHIIKEIEYIGKATQVIPQLRSASPLLKPRNQWYNEKELEKMTAPQKSIVNAYSSQNYKITSVAPVPPDGSKIYVIMAKGNLQKYVDTLEIGPDGKISNRGVHEDITTRAELDKGVMKAVNVESFHPLNHPVAAGMGVLVGTMAARNIKDLVKRKLAKRKLNKSSEEKKNVKSEMIVGSEQTFLDKVKQRKQLHENQENGTIYKDRQGGNDVYWIYSSDEDRNIYIKPENIDFYVKRGYKLVDLKDADRKNEETGTGAVSGYSTPFGFKKKTNEVSGTRYFAEIPTKSQFKIPGKPHSFEKISDEHATRIGKKEKIKFKNDTLINLHNANEEETMNEMTSTGDAAGYMTPYAFAKNKEGSPRAIQAAKKYGKIVKSISKEEQ